MPIEIVEVPTVDPGISDDVFLLSASWEGRCLGVASRLKGYTCKKIIMSIYEDPSELREENIKVLDQHLAKVGSTIKFGANKSNPLPNVRQTVDLIKNLVGSNTPRVSIDISSFTRKHLLQLLQGMDMAGLLGRSQFLYTEPEDYHTQDDEPISHGISSVKAIETFTGKNNPSRDSLLVLFLGYEGRRALALWEHLEPNITLPVIADPPTREHWRGRTEAQNRYLLSSIPQERHEKSHALDPAGTERLLTRLTSSQSYSSSTYNYRIAPLGTKAQMLGLYRFWRKHPGQVTIMYASPERYRQEQAIQPFGRSWILDKSHEWN